MASLRMLKGPWPNGHDLTSFPEVDPVTSLLYAPASARGRLGQSLPSTEFQMHPQNERPRHFRGMVGLPAKLVRESAASSIVVHFVPMWIHQANGHMCAAAHFLLMS